MSDLDPCINHNRWQLDCLDCNPPRAFAAPKASEAPVEEYTLMDALRASAGRPPLPKPAPAPEPKVERRSKGGMHQALDSALLGLSDYDPHDENHYAKNAVSWARGVRTLGDVGVMRRSEHVSKAPEPKQGSEEPILPVTELEAEKSTSKILRALLAKAEAERDEARATKDMHKERQEEAWAEVAALRAKVETWKEQYEAETRSFRNLVAFAREPITPNYEKPMQGEHNVVRDTLARLFGFEIMATQKIDALHADLATAREEISKLRKFVSKAMHEADAEKASADRAERENEELAVSYNELKAKYNRAEERVKELEDMMVTSITPCEGACVDEDCDMVRAILAASAHKEGESR